MRAGPLDRRIDLERKTISLNTYGEPVETWSALVESEPSAYRPISGDERFTAEQFVAKQQVEFRIRYSPDLADLNPLDRIVYPTGSSSERDIYDIIGVAEIGRREGLSILCVRRTETSAVVLTGEGLYFGEDYFGSDYMGGYFGASA